MMIVARILLAPIILAASLYLGIFGAVYSKCDDYTKEYLETPLLVKPYNINVTFKEVSPYITPWSIGIKILGIKEKIGLEEIEHLAPLYVAFNPWLFNLTANYEGISLITKQNSSQLKVDVNTSLVFNFKYSFDALAQLTKNRPAKLINYLKTTTLEYEHLKLYDEHKKINLFDAGKSKFMLITMHDNYSEVSDIINNPPKYYSLSGIANINKSTNLRKLAPYSVIYGFIPNFDFKGPFFLEIDSKADKFDLNHPFDKAKTRFICDKCTSSTINLNLNSEIDNTTDEIKLIISSDLQPKKTFLENLPLWYLKLIKNLTKYDRHAVKILSSPAQYLPPIDYSSTFNIKTKSSLKLTDKKIDAIINNLIVTSSSGCGIMINGKANLDSHLFYNLKLNIVLSKAKEFLDYWSAYFYKNIFNKTRAEKEVLEFNQEINFLAAKAVSEYPTSKSSDLMFSINFESKNNELQISNMKIAELLITYYKIRSQKLLENAAKSNDPLEYIKRVTPELAPLANDLLKELPKDKKVSKELWKKLIE